MSEATTTTTVNTSSTAPSSPQSGSQSPSTSGSLDFADLGGVLDGVVESYLGALNGEVGAEAQDSQQEAVSSEPPEAIEQQPQLNPQPAPESRAEQPTVDAEFVVRNLGFESIEDARIASALYKQFVGDSFNPNEFMNELARYSPARVTQLVQTVVEAIVPTVRDQITKSLFGDSVSREEIEAFRRFKEAGGLLGVLGNDDGDIPEALKYNADGTPKSEEEVEFLRSLKAQAREAQKLVDARRAEEEARKQQEQQAYFAKVESEYTGQFARVVDQTLAHLLGPNARTLGGLRYAIMGMFGEFPENARLFNEGLAAAMRGDAIGATRAAKEVQKRLLALTTAYVQHMKRALAPAKAPVSQQQAASPQPRAQQVEQRKPERKIDTRAFVEQKIRELKARGLI